MAGESIEVIPGEPEAVRHALALMHDDDLVVVLADDVPGVLAAVQELPSGLSAL
jgi:hypothetical protein